MPVMKRGLFLFLSFILLTSQCFAYELVLPREKKSVVNSNYAFFVGKANNGEYILINNLRVYTASNGAFAHSVKLKEGENRVVVKSNYNTQIYRVYRTKPADKAEEKFCEMELRPVIVKNNNVPLRSTPVNSGVNRMSHLFKGTALLINGSKGDFYRVFLSKDDTAWIAKQDVEDVKTSKPAEFINMNGKRYKNAAVQMIAFDKNLPYTVEEREKEIVFKVYNPELSENSVYTLNIPKPKKYTYRVTLEDGLYTFKVSSLPEDIREYTVVIDAGHGGSEKGAVGCLGDEEKDINLKIALELEECLNANGIHTIMTRECDGNISLGERVNIAKDNNADMFISIHLNSIGDIPMNIYKHRGTSIYYFNPNSKELAKALEKNVSKTAGTRRDGVRTAGFYVLTPPEYTSVLVEAAYMTNPMDSVLYRSEDFASNVAKGITAGILEYLGE